MVFSYSVRAKKKFEEMADFFCDLLEEKCVGEKFTDMEILRRMAVRFRITKITFVIDCKRHSCDFVEKSELDEFFGTEEKAKIQLCLNLDEIEKNDCKTIDVAQNDEEHKFFFEYIGQNANKYPKQDN